MDLLWSLVSVPHKIGTEEVPVTVKTSVTHWVAGVTGLPVPATTPIKAKLTESVNVLGPEMTKLTKSRRICNVISKKSYYFENAMQCGKRMQKPDLATRLNLRSRENKT